MVGVIPVAGFLFAWVVLVAVWTGLWQGPLKVEHVSVLERSESEEARRDAELAYQHWKRFDDILEYAQWGAFGPLACLVAVSFIVLLTETGRPPSGGPGRDSGLAIIPLVALFVAAAAALVGPWMMIAKMYGYVTNP
jgi:hypothetical protein